ncbi:Aldo/keto reductase [Sporormia fimetaria CBS 119925]|uniref:Aldo/keto reductase n=1 Tax=Sporormia fimetaria CBS 119925 TaxID=1340428 RepID=A0A6A6VCT1_9PLEO|nr:Aldo/keto reductase [Sporormia fimetaria CBS 119925]
MASTTPAHPATSTSTSETQPLTSNSPKPPRPPLSSILPPLIFGTATFNHQYNTDPFALDTTGLVTSALHHGIRAFDTSPYYGPAEQLLGDALATPSIRSAHPRSSYCLLTKVGRIASREFDYSPAWIRQSIARSLQRLQTSYLDLVYCHDIEFVPSAEVLEAVRELRRIRDEEGTIRYIGISGYPVDVLAAAAEMVVKETGEPVDAVQSFANYTLQNQRLVDTGGLKRMVDAGVQIVTNASPLGMGLLRREGVPVGAMGDFHPAPRELREAIWRASRYCDGEGEKIEVVALRWALENWIEAGAVAGTKADPASGLPGKGEESKDIGDRKIGVSVIGVSKAHELDDTMRVWRSILDGVEGEEGGDEARELSRKRRQIVENFAEGVRERLGDWFGYAWDSPGKGWINERKRDD